MVLGEKRGGGTAQKVVYKAWEVEAGVQAGSRLSPCLSMTDSASTAPSELGVLTLSLSGGSTVHDPLLGTGNQGRLKTAQPKAISLCFSWKIEIRVTPIFESSIHPTNNFLTAYWVPGPGLHTNYSFK